MAKTIDQLQVDISVTGANNLNAADASLKNIEKSAAAVDRSFRSFNTR